MSEAKSFRLPQNPQELEQCLQQMQVPDTNTVKRATVILKGFLKTPGCLEALLSQIKNSKSEGVRHMAGVLLRAKLWHHFKRLKNQQKANQIKETLLRLVVAEKARSVRRGLAALIATLAKKLVPKRQWDDLFGFLVKCSQQQATENRAISLVLFRALLEELGIVLKPKFGELQQIFGKALKDQNVEVRYEAMKATNVLVTFFDQEAQVVAFRPVVPVIVAVVKHALQQRSDKREQAIVGVGFEVFDNLSELPVDAMVEHMVPFMQFLLQVAIGKPLDMSVRRRAGNLLCAFIQHKPGKVVKGDLVAHCLKAATMLMCEPNKEGRIESEDLTPEKIGTDLFDAIVIYIPHQLIFQPIMKHTHELINSQDINKQKGGFLMLGTMAEGYGALMLNKLEGLLQSVCRGLQSSNSVVREAALLVLVHFAEEMGPPFLKFHKLLVPQLLRALDDTNLGVRQKACLVLSGYCQDMDPKQIGQYVDPLVKKLVGIIQSSKNEKDICRALSALKAVASGAEQKFNKYLQPMMKLLSTMMTKTGDDFLMIRAYATDCVGAIANAVGKVAFKKYFRPIFELAVKGCEDIELFSLREKTFYFFSNLALAFGQDFAPALERICPIVLASILSDDGVNISRDSKVLDEAGSVAGMAGEVSDSEEEDLDQTELYRTLKYEFRSGALDMKLAGIATLQSLFEEMGQHMLSFTPRILAGLQEMMEYPSTGVRMATVRCFGAIHELFLNAFPHKVSIGQAKPVPKATRKVLETTIPLLVQMMADEENMACMAVCCEVLARAGHTFGLVIYDKGMVHLGKSLKLLLQQRHACQTEQEEGVVQDHDEVLIGSVTRLVEAIAKAAGGQKFVKLWKEFLPPVLEFCKPHRPVMDRGLGVGCMAEVAGHMGAAVTPFFPTMFPVAIQQLGAKYFEVKRNACYAAGSFFRVGGNATLKYYQPVYELLQPLCQIPLDCKDEERLGCKDNAISCLAKMIRANPRQLSLQTALPLLLKGLPLQEDFEESQFVYPLLPLLCQQHFGLIQPHLPHVIRILSVACAKLTIPDEPEKPRVPEPLRRSLCKLAKDLYTKKKAEVTAVVKQLGQQQQAVFMQALKQS